MKFASLIVGASMAVQVMVAQDVPPPPKPPDDGPSLEVTMKYIQDKLNGQGKIAYTFMYENAPQDWGELVSRAIGDGPKCELSWHAVEYHHNSRIGNDNSEGDRKFSFREAAKILVEPYPPGMPDQDTRPPIFNLHVVMNPGKNPRQFWFLFREEEMAGRMAKAMVHAVELCGGGDKDPFK